MKESVRYIRIALFALGLLILGLQQALAQLGEPAAPRDIFEALSSSREGEGTISLRQPAFLREKLERQTSRQQPLLSQQGAMRKVMGWRISMYNGSLPESKQVVHNRAAKVRTAVDGLYKTYIIYKAPFWRLLVGDFLSREEGQEAIAELSKLLPDMKREMYLVKYPVVVSTATLLD